VTEKTRGLFSLAEQRVTHLGDFFLKNKYLAQGRELLVSTAAKVSGRWKASRRRGPARGAGEEGAAAGTGAPGHSAAEDPLVTARDETPAAPPPPSAEAPAPPSDATEDKPEGPPAKQPAPGDTPVF